MLEHKQISRVLLPLLLLPMSFFVHSETYNVGDFEVAGITSGDSGTDVHSKIADYFSIDPSELKLVDVKEKPTKGNVLAPGENRKYEYGDYSISVSLVPNYIHESDHSLVVSRVYFEPLWGVDKKVRLEFVERVRDEFIAQHGEPSLATKGNDTRLKHFYWCTTMTVHKRWPCVLKEPHVHLHQLVVKLNDERYQNAWTYAAIRKNSK